MTTAARVIGYVESVLRRQQQNRQLRQNAIADGAALIAGLSEAAEKTDAADATFVALLGAIYYIEELEAERAALVQERDDARAQLETIGRKAFWAARKPG